jgi:BBSome-interacting protein 1
LLENLKEIIPKNGLIYSEKFNFSDILCKPKILPLKSLTLMKLEEMEKSLNADI